MSGPIYTVRRLSQVGRGEVQQVQGRGGIGGIEHASAQAGAVYSIAAEELTLDEEQVIARLRQGWLRSTDLVLVDGRWSSLLDSAPFSDEAAARARVEAAGRTVRYLLLWAAPLLIAAALVAALFAWTWFSHH